MKQCKKCGRKYHDKQSFCEDCGQKLIKITDKHTETQKIAKQPTTLNKNKIGIIAVIVIIGIFIILNVKSSYNGPVGGTSTTETECIDVQESYAVQEPYQVTKSDSNTLSSLTADVSNLNYYVASAYVDINNKFSNVVSGSISETSGHDIKFLVFDQKNYDAWKNHQNYGSYVSTDKIKSYSFSFIPDHSDTYYFVFDNTYSIFTSKKVTLSAVWNYQFTATEYREVTKYRTVQKCT